VSLFVLVVVMVSGAVTVLEGGRIVLVLVFHAAERELVVIRHLRIRIAELAEIGGARTDVEIAEQR
jgi:hypothetical protein